MSNRLLTDAEIHKLTDHWNPVPSRLEGFAPETIKLRLFQTVADAEHAKTLKAVGESALAVEIEKDYILLKLPRGLIPEPIKLKVRGELPE